MAKPVALYYTMMQYQPENRALLERLFTLIERPHPDAVAADDLSRVEVLFAPLGYQLDRRRMDSCPRLRAIVSNTTGVPHIDMAEAERRGIAVCALHDEQAFLDRITPTAEHAIGLMLSPPSPAAGRERRGGRGAGGISRPWRRASHASRMSSGSGRIWPSWPPEVGDVGARDGYGGRVLRSVRGWRCRVPLELAPGADVLTCMRRQCRNGGLVSRAVLSRLLPQSALVVNTARGELLDVDALLDLLESGHFWAAALDVARRRIRARFCRSRLADEPAGPLCAVAR